MHLKNNRLSRIVVLAFCLSGSLIIGGCANLAGTGTGVTASDPTKMTRSGFLSDYEKLAKAPVGDGIQCWRTPSVDVAKYDKILISRMVVTLSDEQGKGVDPTDLKALVDYFHGALVKALKPQMQIVDKPGAGVLVLRIALTNLVPTEVGRSVMGTAIPYGFVAEAGSGVAAGGPAGSTPYLGQTGIELQLLDGEKRTVLAECRDTQVGRKYAADVEGSQDGATATWINGYMNSFQSWSYARNAFDKWALLLSKRLADLRGVKLPAKP